MDGDDLEYREERAKIQTPVKKLHIPLKLKSNTNQISVKLNKNLSSSSGSDSDKKTSQTTTDSNLNKINEIKRYDADKNNTENSSHLESSYKRQHVITNMNWNFNVSSCSQKITDQTMDFCMICNLPILIYGRLIPCKHVMCIQCAHNIDLKVCLKESCNERIDRIETALRGGVFVCLYDMDQTNSLANAEAIRFNPDISQKKLCGRSYMSQRDLNSHIQHRHEIDSNPV